MRSKEGRRFPLYTTGFSVVVSPGLHQGDDEIRYQNDGPEIEEASCDRGLGKQHLLEWPAVRQAGRRAMGRGHTSSLWVALDSSVGVGTSQCADLVSEYPRVIAKCGKIGSF
jgi:hypothetical protein